MHDREDQILISSNLSIPQSFGWLSTPAEQHVVLFFMRFPVFVPEVLDAHCMESKIG